MSFNHYVAEELNLLKTSSPYSTRINISSRLSSNSEANASELLDNREEICTKWRLTVDNLSSKSPVPKRHVY